MNVIIALGHSGVKRDKEIAVQCPEVDLVVGGHCKIKSLRKQMDRF